jgi:hypothetical protein
VQREQDRYNMKTQNLLTSFLALSTMVILQSAACSDDGDGGSSSSSGSTAGTGGAGGAGSGTSSSTSSSSGAGAAGGGGEGGQSSVDPCSTALFCDDFEAMTSGAKPSGPWSVREYDGSVVVDGTRHYSGNQALKATTRPPNAFRSALAVYEDSSVLPVDGNAVYGRMMYYLESVPTTSVHSTIVNGEGVVPGEAHRAQYRYGGMHPVEQNGSFAGHQWMANYDTPDSYMTPPVGPGSDCWKQAPGEVLPVGQWVCLEWFFDGPNNDMRLWADGEEITAMRVSTTGDGCVHQPTGFTWSAPEFERFQVGWETYQQDNAERTIWIDDFALSTERLGCPSPP